MRKSNLSSPLLESDRAGNSFAITLLTHHFFDQDDIKWLGNFTSRNLSDDEARTLIAVREMGAITNADYRNINFVDTLTASAHLRRLRDLKLLEQKGGGNATYYLPTSKLLAPGISAEAPGSTIRGLPQGFPPLPEELVRSLQKIGKRTAVRRIKNIILQLCAIGPLKLPELVQILQRDPDHLRKHYISKMLDNGELECLFSEIPNHPQQAYKAKKS